MNDGNVGYIFQKYPRHGVLFFQSGVKAYFFEIRSEVYTSGLVPLSRKLTTITNKYYLIYNKTFGECYV